MRRNPDIAVPQWTGAARADLWEHGQRLCRRNLSADNRFLILEGAQAHVLKMVKGVFLALSLLKLLQCDAGTASRHEAESNACKIWGGEGGGQFSTSSRQIYTTGSGFATSTHYCQLEEKTYRHRRFPVHWAGASASSSRKSNPLRAIVEGIQGANSGAVLNLAVVSTKLGVKA